MLRINSIIKEINEIPENRLQEIYEYIHSINPKSEKSDLNRKNILSFAGAFADLTTSEYSSFIKETKRTRAKLFSRKIDL